MELRKTSIALALALAVSALGARAEAQSVAGQVRLGGDVTVFDGLWFPDPDVAQVTFGIFRGFGPSFGYAITEAILIGARFLFGGTWVDNGFGGDNFAGAFAILPYFEFNIVDDSTIQPFFGAEAGYDYIFGDGINDDGRFRAGGIGGIHIFATSTFSISPTGHLGFAYDFNGEEAALTWGVNVQFLGWFGGDGSVTVTVQ